MVWIILYIVIMLPFASWAGTRLAQRMERKRIEREAEIEKIREEVNARYQQEYYSNKRK